MIVETYPAAPTVKNLSSENIIAMLMAPLLHQLIETEDVHHVYLDDAFPGPRALMFMNTDYIGYEIGASMERVIGKAEKFLGGS